MIVNNVAKPSNVTVLFDFIMQKNFMYANSVVKLSDVKVTFECMKELIMVKNVMTANSVVKLSEVTVPFKDIK